MALDLQERSKHTLLYYLLYCIITVFNLSCHSRIEQILCALHKL